MFNIELYPIGDKCKLNKMKIRIKEKSVENTINYLVQVKRRLIWRTLNITTDIDEAIKVVDCLKKMKEINDPKNEEVVLYGWMARNQYSLEISRDLFVFSEYPTYTKSESSAIWDGNEIAQIRSKKHLFGEIGLEPRKVKITIEKL